MSEEESEIEDPPSRLLLDSEALISELKNRPALYDKTLQEYTDRNLKEKLWEEVCEALIINWSELSKVERRKIKTIVQKKWKNLRDCFTREITSQRQCTSKRAAKKRRKYLHFDSLQFLIPFIKERCAHKNIPVYLETTNEIEMNKQDVPKCHIRKHIVKKSPAKPIPYKSSLQVSKENQNDEIDEDKSFANMLVPMLRKLDDDQKHYAKIGILNVMKNAREFHLATSDLTQSSAQEEPSSTYLNGTGKNPT